MLAKEKGTHLVKLKGKRDIILRLITKFHDFLQICHVSCFIHDHLHFQGFGPSISIQHYFKTKTEHISAL